MAFAALIARRPTALAAVFGLALYFSQEGATRLHRTQLTCGKPARITDEKSGDARAAVEERHSTCTSLIEAYYPLPMA